MRPFGQLVLNFLVNLQLLLQGGNFLFQFFIFENQFLGLLRLVFKFRGQLVILEHSQTRSSFKLLPFQGDKVLLHFLNLVVHFILYFVSRLNFFPFLVCDLSQLVGLLDLNFLSKFLPFLVEFIFFVHVEFIFRKLAFIFG
jgi:hypothetical protein